MSNDKKFIFFITVFYAICLFQIFAGLREDWPFSYFGMFKGRMSDQHVVRLDLDFIDSQTGFKKSIYEMGFDSYNIIRKLRFYLLNEALDASNSQIQLPDYSLLKKELSTDVINQLKVYLDQEVVELLKKRKATLDGKNRYAIVLRLKYWEQFNGDNKNAPTVDKDLYVHQL